MAVVSDDLTKPDGKLTNRAGSVRVLLASQLCSFLILDIVYVEGVRRNRSTACD